MTASSPQRYAVVLPAHNEEPCLAAVLTELRTVLDPARFVFAIGVNDSFDRTAEIALTAPQSVVARLAAP